MTGDRQLFWLNEEDVRELVDLNDVIAALAAGLPLEADGRAANVEKALGVWSPSSSMHTLGSMMTHAGYVGFKTWANTPSGAAAVFSLFDSNNGELLALIEAAALGQMRTSAISGVATDVLASSAADELAVIGTGAQAMMQVAAVSAVRSIRRLRVYSPNDGRRGAFVNKARSLFDFQVVDAKSVDAAVDGASIITLITRASNPFLGASMIQAGTHINAAGAIIAGKAEFEQDILHRTDVLLVDNVANARKGSQELADFFEREPDRWSALQTLGEFISSGSRRPSNADITLFKPMGMGLSDLCVASIVYERAIERGRGTSLDRGKRAIPRWNSFTAGAVA